MILLIELAWKASLLLGVALLAARGTRNVSAAWRHTILAAGVVGALSLPLVRPIVPGWGDRPSRPVATALPDADVSLVESTEPGVRARRATGVRPPPPAPQPARLVSWSVVIWGVGSGVSLLWLVAGLLRLRLLAAGSRELRDGVWIGSARAIGARYGMDRTVRLLERERPALLVAFGWWRPTVLLPAAACQWGSDRVPIVLAHELAHLVRGDWPLQVAGEVLRALLWWNPVAWLAVRQLRIESEQACDDLVLATGIESTDYAATLLALARELHPIPTITIPAPAMSRPSSLERRVTAMLNRQLNRTPLSRARRARLAVGAVAATVLVAGFGVAAQGFSTVTGQASDSFGGRLPGVTLTLTNQDSGQKYQVTTNVTGAFELVGVTNGRYVLTATRPGFNIVSKPLTVAARSVRQDMTLAVGSLEETIMIRGGGAGAVAATDAKPRSQRVPRPAPAACDANAPQGTLKPPVKIADVRPQYPAGLDSVTGPVKLEFDATVAPDGTVREVRPVTSDAPPEMVASAAEAIRQWEYTSTLLNCTPIEVAMRVHVLFSPPPPLPPPPPAPPQ